MSLIVCVRRMQSLYVLKLKIMIRSWWIGVETEKILIFHLNISIEVCLIFVSVSFLTYFMRNGWSSRLQIDIIILYSFVSKLSIFIYLLIIFNKVVINSFIWLTYQFPKEDYSVVDMTLHTFSLLIHLWIFGMIRSATRWMYDCGMIVFRQSIKM